MGLMTAQLRNGHNRPVAETAQLDGGAAAAIADDCEPLATATQGWCLLTGGEQGAAGPFTATVAAHQGQAGDQDEQRAAQVTQSSKRELLSRGLPLDGRELRGAWRLLLGRFEARGGSEERLGSLEALGLALGRLRFGAALLGVELRLGVKAASSAPDEADSLAGRSGRPMGRLPRRWSSRSVRLEPKSGRRSSRASPARKRAIRRERSSLGSQPESAWSRPEERRLAASSGMAARLVRRGR